MLSPISTLRLLVRIASELRCTMTSRGTCRREAAARSRLLPFHKRAGFQQNAVRPH